jgi:hypothetical protein
LLWLLAYSPKSRGGQLLLAALSNSLHAGDCRFDWEWRNGGAWRQQGNQRLSLPPVPGRVSQRSHPGNQWSKNSICMKRWQIIFIQWTVIACPKKNPGRFFSGVLSEVCADLTWHPLNLSLNFFRQLFNRSLSEIKRLSK